jgi:hypothetical protein
MLLAASCHLENAMSVSLLLKAVGSDTTGQETALRVIGAREPPSKMTIQIAVTGTAHVQIQGRIARDAPWLDIGPGHSASALLYIDPVQFLRAVAEKVGSGATVSVWAVWAW